MVVHDGADRSIYTSRFGQGFTMHSNIHEYVSASLRFCHVQNHSNFTLSKYDLHWIEILYYMYIDRLCVALRERERGKADTVCWWSIGRGWQSVLCRQQIHPRPAKP